MRLLRWFLRAALIGLATIASASAGSYGSAPGLLPGTPPGQGYYGPPGLPGYYGRRRPVAPAPAPKPKPLFDIEQPVEPRVTNGA